MKRSFKPALLITIILLLFGCSNEHDKNEHNYISKADGRWYTQSQAATGKIVFAQNCANCHGKNAEGTPNWKQPLADDSYPPPPLNGSAHTWHHPMPTLKRTINNGGIPLGGKMPAFKDKLSEEEKDAVIAFFQSKWGDEIYAAWQQR